ncbi:hypothetical protein PGIGA_G00087640 [Pangasianodon gigas]|uniref:Uncharacterized protein n=1 Tax=Pangasianodon gigas TaxID=30993 RepID=A0ACC5XBI1_PANGG|nr:hypothetical protein [Pangasianodon gigas]
MAAQSHKLLKPAENVIRSRRFLSRALTVRSPMQSAAETVENASILSSGSAQEGHRLWIGNIDPKITEYHLVKLLEKFGKVKQFDFLFHKSGPLEGQPRGYCFVNFHTKEEAERAIQRLNGKLALSKKLVVRWAHAQVKLLEKFGKVKQFDFLFHKSGPLEGQPRGYCFVNFHTKEEAERAIQRLNGKLALSKKLVVRWAHAQRFEPYRGDKNLPASLEPSCSEAEEQPTSLSVSAKIKAIEAKLQMMEENVDEEYSGPSPYLYNKPPEKKDKRSQPYNKQFRRWQSDHDCNSASTEHTTGPQLQDSFQITSFPTFLGEI